MYNDPGLFQLERPELRDEGEDGEQESEGSGPLRTNTRIGYSNIVLSLRGNIATKLIIPLTSDDVSAHCLISSQVSSVTQ